MFSLLFFCQMRSILMYESFWRKMFVEQKIPTLLKWYLLIHRRCHLFPIVVRNNNRLAKKSLLTYFFSSLHLSKFIFHVFGKAWFMTWLVACLLGLACSNSTTHIMRNAKFSAFFHFYGFGILKTRKRKRIYASKDNEITRCLNQLLCAGSLAFLEGGTESAVWPFQEFEILNPQLLRLLCPTNFCKGLVLVDSWINISEWFLKASQISEN